MSNKERESDAKQFLQELGKGLPSDHRTLVVYAEEATIQIDPETGKKINSGFWPAVHRDGDYIKSECNDYACISSAVKSLNKTTGKMRYWRSEQNFGAGTAFFVDDIGEGKGSKGGKGLEEWLTGRGSKTPPTAIVETSPNNYQCWYFFKEPVISMGNFRAFLYNFVHNILEGAGGDVTIKDVTRVGRMPYGINNKRNPDGSFKYTDENGRPFRVRLHSADYSRRYSLEELAESFQFELTDHIAGYKSDDAADDEARMKRILSAIESGGSEDIKALAKDKMRWLREEKKYNQIWYDMVWDILDAAQMGEGENGSLKKNQSEKVRIQCPLGHEHTNGDPYGAYFRGNMPGADHEYVSGCAHDVHRKEKNKFTWATLIDLVVMPSIYIDLGMVTKGGEIVHPGANEYWANIEDMPKEQA